MSIDCSECRHRNFVTGCQNPEKVECQVFRSGTQSQARIFRCDLCGDRNACTKDEHVCPSCRENAALGAALKDGEPMARNALGLRLLLREWKRLIEGPEEDTTKLGQDVAMLVILLRKNRTDAALGRAVRAEIARLDREEELERVGLSDEAERYRSDLRDLVKAAGLMEEEK